MCGSGRQLGAALTATRGQDGATGAGPHAGTEAVRAAAAPVTRLERALAHGTLPGDLCRRTPSGARERPLSSATRLLYAAAQPGANRLQRRPWPGPSRLRRGVWRLRQMVLMTSRWTRQEDPFRAATS